MKFYFAPPVLQTILFPLVEESGWLKLGCKPALVQVLALTATWVTLGELRNLSEPPYPDNNNSYQDAMK